MALGAAGLELVLPNGTTRYVALGTGADELAGTFAELSTPGYARKGHAAWVTEVTAQDIRRKNNGAIVFDALTNGIKDVTWWAVFDAAVAGNLLAAGLLLNLGGSPQPAEFGAGDQPRFNDGALRIIVTSGEV